MLGDAALHLYARAVAAADQPKVPIVDVPWWALLLVLFDLVVFVPVWMIINYTFIHVLPTLAMIEDENPPPVYAPVGLDDPENVATEQDYCKTDPLIAGNGNFRAPATRPLSSPVTSSLRSTIRALQACAGKAAWFHGMGIYCVHSFAIVSLHSIFSAFLPVYFAPAAYLAANFAIVQLRVVWVHVVATPPSAVPFWRRLTPFRRTFKATAVPTVFLSLASCLAVVVPLSTMQVLGLQVMPTGTPPDSSIAWKAPIFLLSFTVHVAVILATIVLCRVEAGLLPEDETTIVPFDRSFGGLVLPEVLTGRGYLTFAEACKTISLRTLRRIFILYFKVFCISVFAICTMLATVGIQFAFVSAYCNHQE